MTKRSNEIPDGQMRIGDEAPETEAVSDIPVPLQIPEDKVRRFEEREETEGRHQALLQTLPREHALRIIGHDHSTDERDKHTKNEQERLASQAQPGLGPEALTELIKSTYPKEETQPPKTHDEAA